MCLFTQLNSNENNFHLFQFSKEALNPLLAFLDKAAEINPNENLISFLWSNDKQDELRTLFLEKLMASDDLIIAELKFPYSMSDLDVADVLNWDDYSYAFLINGNNNFNVNQSHYNNFNTNHHDVFLNLQNCSLAHKRLIANAMKANWV